MEETKLPGYPELNRIALLYPGPQVLLGEEIFWTEKRDGSQLRLALVNGKLKISTHHQDEASTQFKAYFGATEQAEACIELLRNANGYAESPVADFNYGAIIFGELLVKGRSPARFEMHIQTEFVIYDIWSQKDQRFLSYTSVYQQAFHYKLPVVKCWAMSRHTSIESLLAFKGTILSTAKEEGREGTVLKAYGPQIFAKEKIDNPVIPKVEIENGAPRLPNLPDSEAAGAVAKAHADLGEFFTDKSKAMPLIAKYVSEEMDKHLCTKPAKKLFDYYTEYITGLNSQ